MNNPRNVSDNICKQLKKGDFMKISAGCFGFDATPSICAWAATGGKKEGEGPMASYFDTSGGDDYFGQETWEKAESELLKMTVSNAISKARLTPANIDLLFSGDLLNQCISTGYGLRDIGIPLLGLYGACSTFAEALILGAICVNSCFADYAVSATSSHNSTAERQFRFPMEYGGQRTPTAQWTATASGAAVLSRKASPPYITSAAVGKIVDMGITDANNMGAAMAPAAADTIFRYLTDTKAAPSDFDYIVTGDLGSVGTKLLLTLLGEKGIDISRQHRDCGLMIYDAQTQDTHAGGSGCGCSAGLMCGWFMPKVKSGEIKRMLFAATGALMSTTALQQGESVPSISHLVELRHEV